MDLRSFGFYKIYKEWCKSRKNELRFKQKKNASTQHIIFESKKLLQEREE